MNNITKLTKMKLSTIKKLLHIEDREKISDEEIAYSEHFVKMMRKTLALRDKMEFLRDKH